MENETTQVPHRLRASAPPPPNISLGPLLAAASSSLRHNNLQQDRIYIDMPSNANASLAVKGKYICSGVLGGARCNRAMYGSDTNTLYTPVVGRRVRFINGSEVRFIPGQVKMAGSGKRWEK